MKPSSEISRLILVLALALGVATLLPEAAARVTDRTRFPNSIHAVSLTPTQPHEAVLVRSALRPEEEDALLTFEVGLRVRLLPELQARLAQGERVPEPELQSRFLPSPEDYARLQDWLVSQGFTITHTDPNRLAVFARGSVRQAAQALDAQFGRVALDGVEYTSAISAPALPADLALSTVAIHGLQPHLRPRALTGTVQALGVAPPYYPSTVAAAYNANNLGLTGKGETIAILAGAFPDLSDLTAFWQRAGVTNSGSRISTISVDTGPAASPSDNMKMEIALDVQWISSLAPEANIRVYGCNELNAVSFDLAYLEVYADLAKVSGLHVYSISVGSDEAAMSRDYVAMVAQYTALLTNAGVTIIASSGDGGNNLKVMHPASDPSVTGVGGTTVTIDNTGLVMSETAWNNSGGGASAVFSRPPWQVGQGIPVPSSSMPAGRLVPDVAAIADPQTGVAIMYQGKLAQVGGTSASSPIWGAFCVLIDQDRISRGAGPVGLLNPKIYALLGTAAFRDVTSGPMGSIPGYDTYTGIGVPNVAVLLTSLGSENSAPAVVVNPSNPFTTLGQNAICSVVAQGVGLSYRWQTRASATAAWANLADGAGYRGTSTGTLTIMGATYAQNGAQFRCAATNAQGTATSGVATLMVNSFGVTTLAGRPQFYGSDDGLGQAARFNFPGSVRVDGKGNVFVADTGNHTIRKITPDGNVTTLAGLAESFGAVDGIGSVARFHNPGGLVIDNSGNVYVADCRNYAIRKITPDGSVTTFAGALGQSASVDGIGATARFADPQNIAIDTSGNLYVPDGSANTIRKITPDGTVSTIAGTVGVSGTADGAAADARFNKPTGLAVDVAGNIYVADKGNSSVRKITAAGVVSTLATGRKNPAGVAVDATGTVYVSAELEHSILQITPAGVVSTLTGNANAPDVTDGLLTYTLVGATPLPEARYYYPTDLAVDAAGVIYVSDGVNCAIRRIVKGTAATPKITTYPGDQTVTVGTPLVYTLPTTGSDPMTFEWQHRVGADWVDLSEGPTYAGVHSATLTINAADVSLDGTSLHCVVSNNFGSQEVEFRLSVQGPPLVTKPAADQTVRLGGNVTFVAPVHSTTSARYQWYHGGVAIPVGNTDTLIVGPVSAGDVGVYTVAVTNSFGTTTATAGSLALGTSRIINLSARAYVSNGADTLIVGCVVRGTGTKSLVVRGPGPALGRAPFNVANALTQPDLAVYDANNVQIAHVGKWDGSATLMVAMHDVGAFPFEVGSNDAVLVRQFSDGNSTTMISAGTANGVGMAEFYDADPDTAPIQLINISARAQVGTGDNILIAGFVIRGTTSKAVLIRGVGPSLAVPPFNLTGTLPNMFLKLYNGSGVMIDGNLKWDNWDASVRQTMIDTFKKAGAFPLVTGSYDTALVETLPPGAYTAEVVGGDLGTTTQTGIALVEIYDLQP